MISHSIIDTDNRVRRAADALAKKNYEVDILCLRKNCGKKKFSLNGVNVYGIKIRRSKQTSVMDHLLELCTFFVISMLWVTKLFLKKKYNIIHVHNPPDFQAFAALIPKLFGSKVILDIHDILPEFYAQKFSVKKNHMIVSFLKLIEKIAAGYSDHVIVANDIWMEILINRSLRREKINVILNTPDDNIFYTRQRPKEKSRNFTLVYHGALKDHFGLETAIKAIGILKSNVQNLKLKIIGEGPLQNKLSELVSEMKIEKIVQFYEAIPIDRIPEFIIQSDVGIVPKRTGIFSSYALSTKLLEYIKLGIPAVVSRAPVEQSYFDENMVMFFEPDNPEDFARAVMELYRKPEKRMELSQNANEFNRKHNWKHYRQIYYNIIENLCKESKQKWH
jgi:glycosyltransferase involved in cell wall biosynthesis